MIEFRHILCPIDFSDTSGRALTYATAFATWYEAQLTVLHVMGAQGSRGIELMLYGSNTHHVVRAATCPVLTVRA